MNNEELIQNLIAIIQAQAETIQEANATNARLLDMIDVYREIQEETEEDFDGDFEEESDDIQSLQEENASLEAEVIDFMKQLNQQSRVHAEEVADLELELDSKDRKISELEFEIRKLQGKHLN